MHDFLFSGELSIAAVLFRFFISFLLSGIIGFERSRHGRPAGLRTHIIVCLGSTMTALIGQYTCLVMGFSSDPMRVSAQVISGIGFLGAGTILIRGRNHVTGLTTAAGLWTTACIGIATGLGFYSGAVICAIIFFLSAGALTRVETIGKNGKNIIRVYLECDDASVTNAVLDILTGPEYGLYAVEITPPRTGIANHLGIEAIMPIPKNSDRKELVDGLAKNDHILFAVETV
ncbi:MAG: MgtC/SapB family protein [Clostridia bacterium]|nr:MgtC/SapB family protein [Clostridia bacterium]MBQ4605843.1 MgtC/SapB family protein [Clostridia bacterium]